MDGIALRQIIDRIPLLKYRYLGSFPSDRVPMLPNDTFAIVNTEPSYMSGENWVTIAKFKQQLYFADSRWIMQFSQARLPKDGSSKVAVTSQRVRILCHIFSFPSLQVPARATYRSSRC